MTVKALILQSWFDIAIRYTGSVTNAYVIAFDNGFSVTDDLTPGQTIFISDTISILKKEVQHLDNKEVMPATGILIADFEQINPELGIGQMTIGSIFIVR